MTQEQKELLLQDICARLPYGIVLNVEDTDIKLDRKHQGIGILYPEDCSDEFNKNHNEDFYIVISGCYYGNDIKPYLRPLSSMTEEERNDLRKYCAEHNGITYDIGISGSVNSINIIDWLNAHHFDYRGLIEMGIAIEVTENNNPYKD